MAARRIGVRRHCWPQTGIKQNGTCHRWIVALCVALLFPWLCLCTVTLIHLETFFLPAQDLRTTALLLSHYLDLSLATQCRMKVLRETNADNNMQQHELQMPRAKEDASKTKSPSLPAGWVTLRVFHPIHGKLLCCKVPGDTTLFDDVSAKVPKVVLDRCQWVLNSSLIQPSMPVGDIPNDGFVRLKINPLKGGGPSDLSASQFLAGGLVSSNVASVGGEPIMSTMDQRTEVPDLDILKSFLTSIAQGASVAESKRQQLAQITRALRVAQKKTGKKRKPVDLAKDCLRGLETCDNFDVIPDLLSICEQIHNMDCLLPEPKNSNASSGSTSAAGSATSQSSGIATVQKKTVLWTSAGPVGGPKAFQAVGELKRVASFLETASQGFGLSDAKRKCLAEIAKSLVVSQKENGRKKTAIALAQECKAQKRQLPSSDSEQFQRLLDIENNMSLHASDDGRSRGIQNKTWDNFDVVPDLVPNGENKQDVDGSKTEPQNPNPSSASNSASSSAISQTLVFQAGCELERIASFLEFAVSGNGLSDWKRKCLAEIAKSLSISQKEGGRKKNGHCFG